MCKESTCDLKTNFIQALKDHTKEMHERNICKECSTITVGTGHKKKHEKTTHGKEREPEHSHLQTEAPVTSKKGWVQPKKTFINRKVKKLQLEVNKLNKDGNIYNNLHNIPEKTDTQKIKEHFSKTVTT